MLVWKVALLGHCPSKNIFSYSHKPVQTVDVVEDSRKALLKLRADLSAEKSLTSYTPPSKRQTENFDLKKSNPMAGE